MAKVLMIEGRAVPQPLYEKDVKRLVDYYRQALRRIKAELERADVTNFSRAQSLAMMKEVEKVLRQLDADAADWIQRYVPQAAADGAATVIFSLGLAPTYEEAKKVVEFNKLNKAFVENAVADLQEDLLAVTQNVEKRVRQAVRQAVAESMRANMTAGINGRRTLARDTLQRLRKDLGGALDTGIIDAARRRWEPSVYVDMVARTKLAETFRQTQINEGLDRGAQYALISVVADTKDACRYHQGRIIKLSDAAPGNYPTYEQLKASGQIFHPNCRHHFIVIRNLDRLPEGVREQAEKQQELGNKAMATGKRNPDL